MLDPAETGTAHAVQTVVEYLGEMSERPRFHMSDEARDRNVLRHERVTVRDVRPWQAKFSIDREGFAIFPHKTAVRNFRDPEEIRSVYVPELEALVKAATGAVRVLVQRGGVVRLAQRAPDFGAPGTTYPARTVHSDYSPVSGPQTARSLLDPAEADAWLGRRFAVFSVWRALSPPPQDVPLALVDATSVDPADVVLTDVVIGPPGREMMFEGSSFHYNPAHRWCYFRDMHRDEALLIKAYDSDDSRAWRVPHTGFTDPSAPPDAPPRESMDIRAIAFFDA